MFLFYRYTFVPPDVLFIRATKLSDAGSYRYIQKKNSLISIHSRMTYFHRCVATNDFLNVTKKSKEAKLTVISRDEGEESSKPIVLFPQTSYKHTPLNGTNLRLACAASGYPTPTTAWTFVPQSAG